MRFSFRGGRLSTQRGQHDPDQLRPEPGGAVQQAERRQEEEGQHHLAGDVERCRYRGAGIAKSQ